MKSQRGQVQESNLLADKIEQKIVHLRPYLPALLGVVLVGVLGLIGYGVYSTQRESRAARAWTDFYFADTQIQDLDAISKDYSDTSAGLWARMTAGDRGMAQAMEKWSVDRAISDQRFQEAVDDYQLVVDRATDSFMKSRALHGMGQALEGLGKRTEAIDAYRQINLLTGLPAEYLTEILGRVKWLESSEGESFYAWYNERTSAPPATETAPFPGIPSMPDISFPPLGSPPGAAPAGDTPLAPTNPTSPEDKP
jgi:tetratricopeptide (TPR) repeat protein